MSDAVRIDVALFYQRADNLFTIWRNVISPPSEDAEPLADLASILLVTGNSDDENPYRRSSALQTYLLGYEFPSTLMLLQREEEGGKIIFVVSNTKAKLLQPLLAKEGSNTKVELHIRSKNEDENKEIFNKIVQILQSQQKVGCLPKDKMAGKFVTEWNAVAGPVKKWEEIDVAAGVGYLLAIKDSEELRNTTNAALMTTTLMNFFSDTMSREIDRGTRVSHEDLGQRMEKRLEDAPTWKPLKKDGFDAGFGDWCYSPIIQSGGNYDLRNSAQTDDQKLRPGVILCSLGIRYRSYCANLGRSFFVDPDRSQETNYTYLLQLQQESLKMLKAGVVAKDFHAALLASINEAQPKLAPYWKGAGNGTAGFAIGLEFRDSTYILGPKCTRKLRKGMLICLCLGFAEIPEEGKKGKTYALNLVDTVLVQDEGSKLITNGLKSKDDVMFYLDEPEETKPSVPAPRRAAAVIKANLRSENREIDASAISRRKKHQADLAAKRLEQGVARFSNGDSKIGSGREGWRRFESYVREAQLPEQVAKSKILVDSRRNTIILPINGFGVPFHVNALKSVVKQDEGEYTVLRFMFVTPNAISGKKEDTPFEDPSATFIRGITYRSLDSVRFADIHKDITELKKAATKRESERKEFADVIEQDKLVEIKGKRVKLTDVQVRPSFDGKRQIGDVEVHTNGIRYQSNLKPDQKIDVVFSNIKHLFFQPCDSELIAIIHIHLKHPIVIGKKKTKDVQFFREATEATFDETGNKKRRKNYQDEDELVAEQEERKRRAELNKYFKVFSDRIAEASNGRVEVDIPFRELGFGGVPHRSNVLLQPTTDALVFLTEPPFLVLTLSEIEIAHLERVQYGLKNFDLVFVFQDFTKTPIHINTIPTTQLDNVKEWLDSVDIPFTEGPLNLNWNAIMGTVREDPLDFFKEGGWSFLAEKEDGSGAENHSDEESAFEDSGGGESSESAFSDDEGASDDEGSGGDDDEEESGEDWDEQEARLARDDDDRQRNPKHKGRR